jgi:hypothetical protein
LCAHCDDKSACRNSSARSAHAHEGPHKHDGPHAVSVHASSAPAPHEQSTHRHVIAGSWFVGRMGTTSMTTRSEAPSAAPDARFEVIESSLELVVTAELLLRVAASRRASDPAAFRTRFVRPDDDDDEGVDTAWSSPLLPANVPYPPPPLALPLAGAMGASSTEELSGV